MFFAYTSDYSDSQQEGNRKFTRWTFIKSQFSVLDLLWQRALYILVPLLAAMQVVFALPSLATRWHGNGGIPQHNRKKLSFAQTVFFASCGLNSLGLLYSLFYMSNIKQEKASSDSEK